MTRVIVDARGYRCPVPTLKLRRALETADEVELLADDPLARVDVPHFAAQVGAEVAQTWIEATATRFVVRKQAQETSRSQ